ncbi:MAG: hypothetical protein KDK34_16940, partial [Leptospiraceae bacterium]|nr:hypothetical protein [Leptospiraceae bacterium]
MRAVRREYSARTAPGCGHIAASRQRHITKTLGAIGQYYHIKFLYDFIKIQGFMKIFRYSLFGIVIT